MGYRLGSGHGQRPNSGRDGNPEKRCESLPIPCQRVEVRERPQSRNSEVSPQVTHSLLSRIKISNHKSIALWVEHFVPWDRGRRTSILYRPTEAVLCYREFLESFPNNIRHVIPERTPRKTKLASKLQRAESIDSDETWQTTSDFDNNSPESSTARVRRRRPVIRSEAEQSVDKLNKLLKCHDTLKGLSVSCVRNTRPILSKLSDKNQTSNFRMEM